MCRIILKKFILFKKREKMKKSKRLIVVGIVVLVIGCLGLTLMVSTGVKRKSEDTKSGMPQASAEHEIENTDGEDVAVLSAASEGADGVSVQNGSVVVQSSDASNWDLTKVDIVYDTANVPVPVPKGYVASGADGEHTVNTGFVIYEGSTAVTNENAWAESCSRNQWVWVPVSDVSRIYKINSAGNKVGRLYKYSSTGRSNYSGYSEPNVLFFGDNEESFSQYGLQSMSKEKLLHDIQNEFEETIESITRYGGFWIGRYETGNLNKSEPVIQRMNTRICYQNWYTAYIRMKRINTNENVKTSMIFGCLWDETLQWLVDSGNKTYAELSDSTSWGNYGGSTFEYKTDTNGNVTTKTTSSRTSIPAGSTEYTKANNIYDMAGNLEEGTLEGNNSSRACRGGNYYCAGNGYPAPYRGDCDPTADYSMTGSVTFRAYLYIK